MESSNVIGTIYDAAIDPGLWENVLKEITEVSGCSSFSFLYKDPETSSSSIVSYGTDPEIEKSFNEYYYKLDKSYLFAKKYCQREAHLISTFRSLPDKRTMIQEWGNEYYYDFLAKAGIDEMIGTILNQNPKEISMLAFHRRPGSPIIDDEALTYLQSLMPHFVRAQSISKRLLGLSDLNKSVYESLHNLRQGVILFNSLGKPLFINTSAEAMLDRHPQLGFSHRGINCQSPVEEMQLNRLLTQTIQTSRGKSSSGGGSLLIGKNEQSKPLSIMISPINSRDDSPLTLPSSVSAMMLISDMGEERSVEQEFLSEVYGLTPAEVRVAVSIANGRSLEEIAIVNQISIHTVRNQLKAIFSKTDTHRQTELTKRVLGTTFI